MKKLLLFIIPVLMASCSGDPKGHLIPYEPPVVLDKYTQYSRFGTSMNFSIYQDGKLYRVSVPTNIYDRYSVKDTIHGYALVPDR